MSFFKREKTVLDYAKWYREKHGLYSIIPIKPQSKEPLIAWKKYQETFPSENEILMWFNGKKIGDINLAILTGSINSNLIVIDIDSKEKFDKLKDILFKVGLANKLLFVNNWIIKTSKGYHIYFRVKCDRDSFKELFKTKVKWIEGIDIKAEGGYVLAPPSKHPNGDFYEFLEEELKKNPFKTDYIPIIELEEALKLLEALKYQEAEIKEVKIEETPKEAVEEGIELGDTQIMNIVNTLSNYYKEGYRDLIVFSLIGYLIKEGVNRHSIEKTIETLAKTNNDNELANRLYQVKRAYQIANQDVNKLKGISGLKETLTQILLTNTELNEKTIEEEVEKTLTQLKEIIPQKRETTKETEIRESKIEEAIEEYPKELNSNNLYYEITKEIHKKAEFRFFYKGNTEIGLYYFNGITYEEGENKLLEFINEITKEEEFAKRFYVIDKKERVKRIPTPLEIDLALKKSVREEVLAKIQQHTITELREEPLKIAFANGIVLNWNKYLEKGNLEEAIEEANPNLYVFHLIPHDLDLTLIDSNLKNISIEELAKKLCNRALETFKQWVGDKWLLLFEIIGFSLYPKNDLHKAIMLIGEGANGKSTYLRLVKDILGSKNVSSISLQDLTNEENRFIASNLYHKLANIYSDIPKTSIRYTGVFKILTGEDTITTDRKFRDPLTFTNYAKLLFSANRLPKINDTTLAFWRRWILIEFPNQFPINPKFYEETFNEEEIKGIILVSLEAFRRAYEKRSFSYINTEKDYQEMWLRESNVVYAFLRENEELGVLIREEDTKTETEELYTLFVTYCKNEDREILEKKTFTEELASLGIRKVKIANKHYYKGVKINIEKAKEYYPALYGNTTLN